jgi:hypothetical protein
MSSSDQENQQRNREIAHNEAVRQTTSAVRVSGWAIGFTIILGVVVAGLIWAWLNR